LGSCDCLNYLQSEILTLQSGQHQSSPVTEHDKTLSGVYKTLTLIHVSDIIFCIIGFTANYSFSDLNFTVLKINYLDCRGLLAF
jgi:hypothetical protein